MGDWCTCNVSGADEWPIVKLRQLSGGFGSSVWDVNSSNWASVDTVIGMLLIVSKARRFGSLWWRHDSLW